MAITQAVRKFVRQRAYFAYEYCGVRESDSGGQLTVDHFHPLIKGGDDQPENLVYCCIHCNQYKRDYWPTAPHHPHLWNPRVETAVAHLLSLDDGTVSPLTAIGAFTIRLLHLNRSALVAYRQKRQQEILQATTLRQLRELTQVYEQLLEQQLRLIAIQRRIIEEQQVVLQQLLRSK
jgi:hypothetical protein